MRSEHKLLSRAGNLYRQFPQSAPCATNYFRGPQLILQHGQKAAFKIAHAAKQVTRKSGMIGVHSAFGQRAFHRGIPRNQRGARADPKCLARKTFEQRLDLGLAGIRRVALSKGSTHDP